VILWFYRLVLLTLRCRVIIKRYSMKDATVKSQKMYKIMSPITFLIDKHLKICL